MEKDCACSHAKCNKTPKGKMCAKHGMDDCSINEGTLRNWFKGSSSTDGKSGWVNVVTGGTCASDEEVSEACWVGYTAKGMKKKGGKLVPNCVKSVIEQMLPPIDSQKHRDSQRTQKLYNKGTSTDNPNEKDTFLKRTGPQLPLAGKGGSPGQPYDGPDKKGPYVPAPQRPKVQMAHYEPEGQVIDEAPKTIYSVGQTYSVVLNWRTKVINIKFFFPTQQRPTKEEVQAAIDKIYPGAVLYMYTPAINDPTKPFIVANENVECEATSIQTYIDKKRKNYLLNIGVIGESAAWAKKSGKNQKGGLNEKGRKSYETDNPGSDLKAPSKKVGNPRRASFCARMSGMKRKLTSAKTARDPDSRINKSLRAWNC